MKNSILLPIIIALAATPVARATTVGFSATPTARSVVNDTGTAIAAGSLWWVGNFANENFALGAGSVASNWATISNSGGWVALGTETGVAGVSNGDGAWPCRYAPATRQPGRLERRWQGRRWRSRACSRMQWLSARQDDPPKNGFHDNAILPKKGVWGDLNVNHFQTRTPSINWTLKARVARKTPSSC